MNTALEKQLAFKSLLALMLITLTFISLSVIFFTNYYNYGAESISLLSLIKLASGESYVSNIENAPFSINSFSPYFFWLQYPLLKLFNVQSLHSIAILAKCFIAGIIFLYCYFILKLQKTYFKSDYSLKISIFAMAWFFLLFPANNLSIRPDYLSFFFEFLSIYYFFKFYFQKNSPNFFLFIAAFFSGLAVLIKLNTVGFFVGILLFLLSEKKIKEIIYFFTISIFTFLTFSYLAYLVLEDKFIINSILSVKNDTIPLISMREFLTAIINDLFISHIFYYLLIIIGISFIHQKNKKIAKLFFLTLSASFIMATLGQLKIGAYYNYHFGFFIFGAIPLAIALKKLNELTHPRKILQILKYLTFLIISFRVLFALIFVATIYANDLRNYPYEEVKKYLEDNYGKQKIYSSDPNLLIHFHKRAIIAPWVEPFLEISPALNTYIPKIKEEIQKQNINIAISMGSACASWTANGLFHQQIKHINKLEKKFKKICIFTN